MTATVLAKFRTLADGGVPGIATLDRGAFLDVLPTLAGHSRVTLAKNTLPRSFTGSHFTTGARSSTGCATPRRRVLRVAAPRGRPFHPLARRHASRLFGAVQCGDASFALTNSKAR